MGIGAPFTVLKWPERKSDHSHLVLRSPIHLHGLALNYFGTETTFTDFGSRSRDTVLNCDFSPSIQILDHDLSLQNPFELVFRSNPAFRFRIRHRKRNSVNCRISKRIIVMSMSEAVELTFTAASVCASCNCQDCYPLLLHKVHIISNSLLTLIGALCAWI